MGIKFFPSKIGKLQTLNSQNIRMLRTHVNNDIYNKYCLIHNTIYPAIYCRKPDVIMKRRF